MFQTIDQGKAWRPESQKGNLCRRTQYGPYRRKNLLLLSHCFCLLWMESAGFGIYARKLPAVWDSKFIQLTIRVRPCVKWKCSQLTLSCWTCANPPRTD